MSAAARSVCAGVDAAIVIAVVQAIAVRVCFSSRIAGGDYELRKKSSSWSLVKST